MKTDNVLFAIFITFTVLGMLMIYTAVNFW